jgi:hypothetical protein
MSALEMPLTKYERIFAPVQRLACLPADPVTDLVARNGAEGNEEQEFRDMKLSGGGKNASRDEQGITGKKKSNEETRFNENNDAHQQRAAPLDQALHVEQEMK